MNTVSLICVNRVVRVRVKQPLCVAGFVVRGRLLAAGARGAALRDRHQGGQGSCRLTPPAPAAPTLLHVHALRVLLAAVF